MKHKIFFMFMLAVCASVAYGQDASDLRLDEVEVYADKVQTASVLRNTITTITSEQIQNLPVVSVNDLLDLLPAVDIRTRGENGAQADISMRGGTNDQVLILLNGVNITDPRTGHANLDLPIDKSAILKIEVLQGSAIEQFGLNAFSGAINIVTVEQTAKGRSESSQSSNLPILKSLNHQISLEGGNYGYFAPSYNLRGRGKAVDWLVSANYNRSTGYMHNTDYGYGNVFTSGCGISRIGLWQWQAGGQMKKFGSNGFYTLKYPDQYEETNTAFASLNWNKQIDKWKIESGIYYRLHHDTWYLFRPGSENYSESYNPNRHITQLGGINAKVHYYYNIGHTSAGIELRNENILSSVLGEKRNLSDENHTPYSYSKNRLNLNYFIQQTFVWADNWNADAGFAGNYNTMFGHNYTYSARLSYSFAPQSSVYAGTNRTLRLPTFTDLYYKSVTQIANPNLKPEKSYNFELGSRYATIFSGDWHFDVSASLYYRIGQNIIDWIKRPADEKWQSANQTRVDAMGGDILANVSKDKWRISAGYSFANLNQSMAEDYSDYISKYALDYLRHKVIIQFGHPIWKGFGASWTFSYRQRHGEYIDAGNQVQSYKPVYLLDGRVYWKNNFLEVYVAGSNLLDIAYYDYGGIVQPGRWLKAGITCRFP